jgi:putative ABC transport system ATP-binding protein
MDYFDAEPEFVLVSAERKPYDLRGKIEIKDLSYLAEGQVQLLDRIALSLQPGEHLALVGFSGSGKSTLALVMGQLYHYDQGRVLLDDKELKTLSKMDVSRNVGFVAQQPFIFDGTIRENLLYACQALFLAADPKEGIALPEREQILAKVHQVGLTDDILRFGLNSVLPRERWQANVPRLIKIRQRFHQQWGAALADLVEVFDVTRFLHQRSIYGNIVFGDPQRDEFKLETVATNPSFRKLLKDTGLNQPLLELGKNLATQTVMLFRNVQQNTELAEISPVPLEQLEQYGDLVERSFRSRSTAEAKRDEELLLRLALQFVPGQHKLATMPAALENIILEARHRFIEQVGRHDLLECQFSLEGRPAQDVGEVAEPKTGVTFYCPSQYLYTKSMLDNILFGRVRADQAKAAEQVQQWLVELLEEGKLLDEVLDIGLDFQVGSKGDRLSGGQKQKVALARALLKKPRILILDEATASLDNTSQARIQRLLETELKGVCTVVAVMHRLDMAGSYDQIAVLKAGKIVESGQYAQLMEARGIFYDLRQGTFQSA